MLRSLAEAKEFALEKVQELAQDDFSEQERYLIEFELEDRFYTLLESLVSEEEIENAMFASQEELDAYLFHRVPNYLTLLEQTTIEFLSDYLS